MKLRLESKDLPIFENVAKCERPCHSYTNESFAMIGCIFAENGPLECGIEVSFIGAGWDAKGNFTLRWRHNDHYSVSNHQPHGCLLNRLFRRRWKKTSKLCVTGLCVGKLPGPVNSPHKGPVMRKKFLFDDVIMRWVLAFTHAFSKEAPTIAESTCPEE